MKLTDVLDLIKGTNTVVIVLYGRNNEGKICTRETIYNGKLDDMPRWVWKNKIAKAIFADNVNKFTISVVEENNGKY